MALPLARPGFLTAAILGFAHTVGEFGVVLMIGGNIPGRTRVLSVLIYDHVEALEYAQAHWLAAALLVFSFRRAARVPLAAAGAEDRMTDRPARTVLRGPLLRPSRLNVELALPGAA